MTSTIRAVSSGGHKFSLNLTLPNAALDNGGTYTAEVEVQRPTGGRATLRKTFHVTVNNPPPITPPPTTPSPSPTTTPPTTPSPTTTPPTSGTHISYCVRIVLSSHFGLPQQGRKDLVDTLTFQIFLYIETDLISLMMQFGQKIFTSWEFWKMKLCEDRLRVGLIRTAWMHKYLTCLCSIMYITSPGMRLVHCISTQQDYMKLSLTKICMKQNRFFLHIGHYSSLND